MAEHPKSIGKYTVTRPLGKGAMGMVYEGFDPVIERKVAIKTILAEYLDAADMEEAIARFKREAQAGGRLQHPSIVGVYEYGGDGHMIVLIVRQPRPRPEGAEKITDQQRIELFRTITAYAGTYKFDGTTIEHNIEIGKGDTVHA